MFTYHKRIRVYAEHDDELVTKQAHKDECDIYKILKQYQRTGVLTHIAAQAPRYEDLPVDVDYQSAMNLVIQAQDAFGSLPARVRDEYGNDPARFLGAFGSESGISRLRELGIINTPPPKAAAPTPDRSTEA